MSKDVDIDPYIGKWVFPENDAPLEMVGRKGAHDLELIAGYLCDLLSIEKSDTVLDLCCGNGLVTTKVASQCDRVVGVDYSPTLLKQAQEISQAKNINYLRGDARKLGEALEDQTFDKAYISAAFQYFDQDMGSAVVANLHAHTKPGATVVIMDIPDKDMKFGHQLRSVKRLLWPDKTEGSDKDNPRFHSLGARIKYLLRSVSMQLKPKSEGTTDELGWWWKRNEFIELAKREGFECVAQDQPKSNPHHEYRFDAVLKRNM